MSRDPPSDDASQLSTDRETIREWANTHDATPYRHREEERYRIVASGDASESHEQVGWDEFFSHLEEGDQVVIYHGEEIEEPFETARREDALERSRVDREELQNRLVEGETVESTVTETTVVEEVIVEEATIESELVDTEIVEDSVIDVELLRRECTGCSLEDTGAVTEGEWFDRDRYTETIGWPGWASHEMATEAGQTEGTTTETEATERTGPETMARDVEEFPFDAVLEVEEAWSVTREFTERFTIESRVTDVDVAETESITGRDIDVEGLQRSIVESNVLDVNLSPEEVMTECTIETQFHEDDTIRTHFDRSRTVEDEIVDRLRLRADVTEAEFAEFERIETRDVDATTIEGESTDEMADQAGSTTETTGAEEPITLSDDDIGKDVVDASGETIGMVTDVDDEGTSMYVDAHPGIADRIKAALDWGGADDDDYPVGIEQIGHVTRDEIQLKAAEELEDVAPAP